MIWGEQPHYFRKHCYGKTNVRKQNLHGDIPRTKANISNMGSLWWLVIILETIRAGYMSSSIAVIRGYWGTSMWEISQVVASQICQNAYHHSKALVLRYWQLISNLQRSSRGGGSKTYNDNQWFGTYDPQLIQKKEWKKAFISGHSTSLFQRTGEA